ncbi:hypothetical protein DUT91_18500 [Phyllobacterium salinisoli]|uniref:Uncharacterized protein n=2 Tax=Phyllobacterium salinisoli TaxID=1899321 RepID=A0A368K3E3_9HYPH|nr:hypothetical protein DUT91_18500 [Phyllobacterium salinisoli]
MFGASLATPFSAYAACTQDRAIYGDRDEHYTLAFKRTPEGVPVTTSNEFTITQKSDGQATQTSAFKLDGVVMWTEGVARPNGMIMHNCPSGDVMGEEFEDCTVWQGVIYALKDGADADLLPKAKEPAAQALLLPDLAGSVDSFDFGAAKPAEPLSWEVFRFRECAPDE